MAGPTVTPFRSRRQSDVSPHDVLLGNRMARNEERVWLLKYESHGTLKSLQGGAVNRGRILLVHTDRVQLQHLRRGLRGQEYDVRTSADHFSALDLVRSWVPDVLLIEFGRDPSAFQLLQRRLRAAAVPQIVALLCYRPGPLRMAALAAGANDYIARPITIPELKARIALAMERASIRQRGTVTRIESADLLIDFDERRVLAAGQEQHLAVKEFNMLRCLLLNANRPVRHEELLAAIGGRGGKRNLRVYIRQLRKKLEPNADQPRYIRTEARIGYRFDAASANIIFS